MNLKNGPQTPSPRTKRMEKLADDSNSNGEKGKNDDGR